MSVTKITVEDIHEIMNTAYAQVCTAKENDSTDVTAIDYSKFVDYGSSDDVLKLREKFTGALIVQISKTFYKDRINGAVLNDIYYEDSDKFGAITQFISATMPSAISNKAMQTFVSGSSTVGQYTVYLPIVEEKLFVKQCSWALPLTITGEQWNSAFKDEASLTSFVQYILTTYESYARLHSELMSRMNRNSFIAKKIEQENGVINLIEEYVKTGRYTIPDGATKVTWADVCNDKDFLMWVKTKISHIKNRIEAYNDLYSTDSYAQSVPSDRIVCEFVDEFTLRIKEADSYVYHNDLITLPNYREITAWQTGGTEEINESIKAILGKDSDEADIVISGHRILGLMVDKYAIMHTNQLRRTPSKYMEFEDVTLYENQFVDKFINNLDNKGVILIADDYTLPTP